MRKSESMTIVEHLEELRRVLLISLLAAGVCSVAVYAAFREEVFALAVHPVSVLGLSLAYMGVAEAFIAKLKLSLLAGIVLASPVLAWQIWSYLVPALHSVEKRLILSVIPFSVLLFTAGVSFGYLAVLPLVLRFLLLASGSGLTPVLSVSAFISFLLSFLLPFGIAFQLPLLSYLMARWEVVSCTTLARWRRYVAVGVFFLAAILTPGPDVVSQTMLGVPMYLLYEISILVARLAGKKSKGNPEVVGG